jgi:hypothetical protein
MLKGVKQFDKFDSLHINSGSYHHFMFFVLQDADIFPKRRSLVGKF